MRHLENIWRVTELAWCTGFTSAVHNCPTSSAHYVNMMGQHINKVTYYTSQGIYEIPVDNLYVPKKAGQTVKVADAKVSAGEAENTRLIDWISVWKTEKSYLKMQKKGNIR